MSKQKNYKKTLTACYLGFVTQAISANFTPLLFLTFKGTYGISLEKIALIPLTFYLTQFFVDIVAAKYADKIGYRLYLCLFRQPGVPSAGLPYGAAVSEGALPHLHRGTYGLQLQKRQLLCPPHRSRAGGRRFFVGGDPRR